MLHWYSVQMKLHAFLSRRNIEGLRKMQLDNTMCQFTVSSPSHEHFSCNMRNVYKGCILLIFKRNENSNFENTCWWDRTHLTNNNGPVRINWPLLLYVQLVDAWELTAKWRRIHHKTEKNKVSPAIDSQYKKLKFYGLIILSR